MNVTTDYPVVSHVEDLLRRAADEALRATTRQELLKAIVDGVRVDEQRDSIERRLRGMTQQLTQTMDLILADRQLSAGKALPVRSEGRTAIDAALRDALEVLWG